MNLWGSNIHPKFEDVKNTEDSDTTGDADIDTEEEFDPSEGNNLLSIKSLAILYKLVVRPILQCLERILPGFKKGSPED
jgi:hypothetical protein